jgi:hypothetical protein
MHQAPAQSPSLVILPPLPARMDLASWPRLDIIARLGSLPIDSSRSWKTRRDLMKSPIRCRRSLVAAALLFLSAGCGSGKAHLQLVRGIVYYQERPLARGTIVFTPDASRGHAGPIASSEIKSDGTYSLRTDGKMGAAPGWYRVTVLAVEMPAQAEAGDRFAVPHSLVPEKYRDPELAELAREVTAGKENRIDFRLGERD